MKAIACYDKETRGIGRNDKMLFNIKEDLEYFKALTINKIVVMGHKTWDSLPVKPLPGRLNIVLTTHPELYMRTGFETHGEIYMNVETFLNSFENLYNTNDIFLIGGEAIFRRLLFKCDQIYATEVHNGTKFKEKFDLYPDAIFPELAELEWEKSPDTYLCTVDGAEVYTTLYTRKFFKTLEIPRITNACEINVNGCRCTEESYRRAYEDFVKRFEFYNDPYPSTMQDYRLMLPCETFYGELIYNGWSKERYTIIDPINSHGVRLVEVVDDHCTLAFTSESLYRKVKNYKKQNLAYMLMRCEANVTETDDGKVAEIDRIIAFDLSLGNKKLAERVKDFEWEVDQLNE